MPFLFHDASHFVFDPKSQHMISVLVLIRKAAAAQNDNRYHESTLIVLSKLLPLTSRVQSLQALIALIERA